MTEEEVKIARESADRVIQYIKDAQSALTVKDLNAVAWYLNLISQGVHTLKELLEDDPV